MDCRYPERRKSLVKKYSIEPFFHSRILKGQEKVSCTGDVLTDEYYMFKYEERNNDKNQGTFICGKTAAKHFLSLVGKEKPERFDPLRGHPTEERTSSSCSSGKNNRHHKKPLAPASKQLWNAINIILTAWNQPPGVPLTKALELVTKFGSNEPYPSEVKRVNSVLARGKKTLSQLISELRDNGNNIRDFQFDLLGPILREENPDITLYLS